MLHTAAGACIDAPRVDRDAAVHQLTARLALRFEPGRMRIVEQTPPLRVVRGFPQPGGSTLVHLHNVSGGVLAGDHLSLDIDVAAGASAQITTTGATRLYRHRAGSRDSLQHITISVGDDALLEYLPDPMIPYSGSRHTQITEIRLGDRATFFGWEMLAPGRQAMGETFAFEHLRTKTHVFHAKKPLFIDVFTLKPREKPLDSMARMGPYSHMATLYAFQTGRSRASPPAFWRELENLLNQFARTQERSGSIWGASTLAANGIVVRGLSHTARDLPATLAGAWSIARRFLTGEDAAPPRKIR